MRKSKRGFALVFALLGVIVLVFLVTEFYHTGWTEIHMVSNWKNKEKAFYIARGGIEFLKLGLLKDDRSWVSYDNYWFQIALLSQETPLPVGDGQLVLWIEDESGKLDLNRVEKENLIRLFSVIDLKREETGEITGMKIYQKDWNELAEKLVNNRPYSVFSEIYDYIDYEKEKGALKPYLTTFSSGKININTVSPEVLMSLGPVYEQPDRQAVVEMINHMRPFQDENDLKLALEKFDQTLYHGLKDILTVKSPYLRVISRGIRGKTQYVIETVLKKDPKRVVRMLWNEY